MKKRPKQIKRLRRKCLAEKPYFRGFSEDVASCRQCFVSVVPNRKSLTSIEEDSRRSTDMKIKGFCRGSPSSRGGDRIDVSGDWQVQPALEAADAVFGIGTPSAVRLAAVEKIFDQCGLDIFDLCPVKRAWHRQRLGSAPQTEP